MTLLSHKIRKWKNDLMHVLYPNFCLICDTETPHTAEGICPVCSSELHYTYFEDYKEATPLDSLFWGRVPVSHTYALLYFSQSTSTQAILHSLKYKDRPDLATQFGKKLGQRIINMEAFHDLDALIPVPLHPKKEFLRGYNQSEMIANGIAELTQKAVNTDLLKRVVFTESQTKKGKASRWENMQERFEVSARNEKWKHVAIVDDVVTTGSTIETCVRILQQSLPEAKISVISLALAR